MNNRPKVVDLFSGAGGLSLGFEQAGFDIVAAVEIDPVHASVHEFNFPECIIIPKSVRDVSGDDILKETKLTAGSIDVVIGGAPCQGFSLIGKRALDDPRNSLVKDFLRLVKELDSNYFVFENVKGLTLGKHSKFLEELIEEASCYGYEVVTPWKVLNSKNFGVPQNRERLFLLGFKKGINPPNYPEPLSMIVTCGQALGDLPNAEDFDALLTSDSVKTDNWETLTKYASNMRCVKRDDWYKSYRRNWNPEILTSSLRTKHTKISINRFRNTLPGTVEPISRFYRLESDGVSNTLRAGTDSSRGAFTSPRPIHYKYNRCITVREMARLHGFPDWFRLHETKWHGARQIGNAVTPPIAREIGFCIIKAIGLKVKKPRKILNLGQIDLLKMDMSNSAKFWGIEVPIAKRNRKSGQKKRKQEDIEKTLKATT